MSNEERASWITLIVNGVIGIGYFSYILSMPADTDLLSPGSALRSATSLAVLAFLILGLACQLVLRMVQRATGEKGDSSLRDERDTLIRLKATRNAYAVLVVFVVVQVVLVDWVARDRHGRDEPDTILELLGTGPLEAMHLVLMLLAALQLSVLTLNASRIFYYRRGN